MVLMMIMMKVMEINNNYNSIFLASHSSFDSFFVTLDASNYIVIACARATAATIGEHKKRALRDDIIEKLDDHKKTPAESV